MKVIGKSDAGYLIAASEQEIANLFGFYWEGEDKYRATLDALGHKAPYSGQRSLIGLEIKPSTAYDQLSWLRSRDREFDELVKKLRATADAIQDHRPLFDAIVGGKS